MIKTLINRPALLDFMDKLNAEKLRLTGVQVRDMFEEDASRFDKYSIHNEGVLRNKSGKPVMVDGKDVMPEVQAELVKMTAFANSVRDGRATHGYTIIARVQ